ncbi:MAG: hypothetical protein AAF787_08935 [Chloroflexota bacterium]
MEILINDTDHFVIRNRNRLIGVMMGVGAVMSVISVIGMALWSAYDISIREPLPTYYWLRMLLLGIVFALGCFFAWVGSVTAVKILRGVTCDFDRATETVTITHAEGIGMAQQQHSIYGVSHALLEANDELQAIALYLVLRSGQRISLGTCSHFDKDTAEGIVRSIRAFLAGR